MANLAWLEELLSDLVPRLAERAARCAEPLMATRLIEAWLRFSESRAEAPELDATARLREVFRGDQTVETLLVPWMTALKDLIPMITEQIIEDVLATPDGQPERYLSAMLFAVEGVAQQDLDQTFGQVTDIAAGRLTLEAALRARTLAAAERAVQHADVEMPTESPGAWTVEDRTIPVWPRFVLVSEDTPTYDHPILRERIRLARRRTYRVVAADRSLVRAFYTAWAEREGFSVEGTSDERTLALTSPLVVNTERVKLEVELGLLGTGPEITVTLTLLIVRPAGFEAKLAGAAPADEPEAN